MIPSSRIKLARGIAIGADALQIILFPLLAEGFISPLDDALDVVVCGTLTWLVGWHLAFLPSFMLKVAPMVDMVPTWTLAVLFATRQKKSESPIIDISSDPPPPPKISGPSVP